ncbi:hypothetical protein U9M48_010152 [Paspalum notatum var. saurae]|uniref:Uncharacterized protein n=1 Tax=Paspalum notatum var. saurae TaxID=547442 RepID=A0AAQ3WFX8_PASNO
MGSLGYTRLAHADPIDMRSNPPAVSFFHAFERLCFLGRGKDDHGHGQDGMILVPMKRQPPQNLKLVACLGIRQTLKQSPAIVRTE